MRRRVQERQHGNVERGSKLSRKRERQIRLSRLKRGSKSNGRNEDLKVRKAMRWKRVLTWKRKKVKYLFEVDGEGEKEVLKVILKKGNLQF